MLTSHGTAATDRPARYLKQLVQHFGNKIETELTETHGVIKFPFGTAELFAEPGTLVARATAEDAENLERLRNVVASHAERFGVKDNLTFEWITPGGPVH
jgi:hypothetical protein